MTIDTRVRWLQVGAGITMGFGLLIAAAALPALSGPAALLLDFVFFPVDGLQAPDGAAARLLSAIGGGMTFGAGAMLWVIATRVYPADPALGRTLILTGVGCWFVVDSLMSVAAGAPLNAFLNVGFLLVFLVPVWTGPEMGSDRISGAA
jgi:hypothetical protein